MVINYFFDTLLIHLFFKKGCNCNCIKTTGIENCRSYFAGLTRHTPKKKKIFLKNLLTTSLVVSASSGVALCCVALARRSGRVTSHSVLVRALANITEHGRCSGCEEKKYVLLLTWFEGCYEHILVETEGASSSASNAFDLWPVGYRFKFYIGCLCGALSRLSNRVVYLYFGEFLEK